MKQAVRGHGVVFAFLLSLCLIDTARSAGPIDLCDLVRVDALMSVTPVSMRYNRRTGANTVTFNVTNLSDQILEPPIYLAFSEISDPNIEVANATDVDANDIPFFVVGETMEPGASFVQSVIFANTGRSFFTWTAEAFAVQQAIFVTIEDPPNLSLTSLSEITVSGTTTSDAVVTINGIPGVNVGGSYSVENVPLPQEGGNILTAIAVGPGDATSSTSTSVTRDTTPPVVQITNPINDKILYDELLTVTATFNDPVTSLLNNIAPTGTVNGQAATLLNGALSLADLALVPGLNTITATVTDAAGNTGTDTVHVSYNDTAVKKILVFAGNNQTAPISTELAQPLVAKCQNEDGSPAANVDVVFRVTQSNGIFTPSSARLVMALTDAQGLASAAFLVGSRTGEGCNRVQATATGFEGTAEFVSTSTGAEPEKLGVSSGERQDAAVLSQAPQALAAIVTDIGNNALSGVRIIFTILEGGGNFVENGSDNIAVTSDVEGRVAVSLMLGPLPGVENNVIEARIEENPDASPVIFVASGIQPGDPAATTVSGVVLDHNSSPLPNVTIHVEGEPEEVLTDDQGQFQLAAPAGPVHLIADGGTTTVEGHWPTLAYEFNLVPGVDNMVDPIKLLPLNEECPIANPSTPVEVTLAEIPGFKLEVPAGSATFPGGITTGKVGVTQVAINNIPMAPMDGMQPNFIITIQPPNVLFDPPAPITYPNTEGLTPGEETNMYSFDHDLGRFVSIGPGTVSEDGTTIGSNPGYGVVKGGWHCAGPSRPQGQAAPVKVTINGKENPDPECLAKDQELQLNAVGTPQPPLDPAKPVQWTLPGGVDLIVGTLNTTLIKVKANTDFPTGSITVKYTCESGEMDTATVPLAGSIRIIRDNNNGNVNDDPKISKINVSKLLTTATIGDANGQNDPANFKIDLNCPGVMGNSIPAGDVELEALKPDGSSFAPQRMINVPLTRVGATDNFRSKFLRLVVDNLDQAALPAQTLLTDWDSTDDTIEILGQKVEARYKPGGGMGSTDEATVCDSPQKFSVAVHYIQGATGVTNASARARILRDMRRLYAQTCIRPNFVFVQQLPATIQNYASISHDAGANAAGDGGFALIILSDRGGGNIVRWEPIQLTTAGETPLQSANRLKTAIEATDPTSGGGAGDRLSVQTFENNAIHTGPANRKSADILVTDPMGGTVTIFVAVSTDTGQTIGAPQVNVNLVVWNGNNFVQGSIEQRSLIRNFDRGTNVMDIYVANQLNQQGSVTPNLLGAAMFLGAALPANQQCHPQIVNNVFVQEVCMDATMNWYGVNSHEAAHCFLDATHSTVDGQLMWPIADMTNAVGGRKRFADNNPFDWVAMGAGMNLNQEARMKAHPQVGP